MKPYPEIFGIDPAPGKELMIFSPNSPERFITKKPDEARTWLRELQARYERSSRQFWVGWDAPLGVDFTASYTQRPIETFLRTQQLGEGVSVLGYSGCQHWTISLDVLGHPLPKHLVKDPDDRLPLLTADPIPTQSGVFETHPAVALAMCWDAAVPKYKGNLKVKKELRAETLRRNQECILHFLEQSSLSCFGEQWQSLGVETGTVHWDDRLDAQLAYLSIAALLSNKAMVLGDSKTGGFIVPKTPRAVDLQSRFLKWIARAASKHNRVEQGK